VRRRLSAVALNELASALSAETGEEFFAALTRYLASALGVAIAFVGEFTSSTGDRVRSRSVFADGKPADNFEYVLADTPCEQVYTQGACTIGRDVQAQFPRDRLLVDMGVEAYSGVILRRGAGSPLGLLVVLDRRPFTDPQAVSSLLNIFAARATAELERQHALAALRDSESRFRRLIDSNLIGVLFWTREGGVIDANDSFLHLIGYSRDDLRQGRIRWTDLTPPEEQARDGEALVELAETGVCTPFEKHYIHKQGYRVPVLLGAAAFEGTHDSGVCWVLDLTQRKQTEEALRDSEAHYRSLIASVDEIVYRMAFDHPQDTRPQPGAGIDRAEDVVRGHRLEFVSERVRDLLGYAPQDFRDNPGLWLDIMHPDDRQTIVGQSEPILGSEPAVTRTYRLRHRTSGDYRWFEDRVTPLYDRDGRLVGLAGVARDITERMQAEEFLRENEAFLALSQRIGQVGSFDWELATDRLLWSEEMYRIFGAIPETFAHSFDAVLGLIHPDDVGRVRQSVERMIASGEAADYEFRICRPDGELRHAWGRGEVVRDATGKVVRVIGTVQDITERRAAEENVRRSEEQLRKVLEASSAMINILRLRDEVILYVNRAWEEATGWARAEAIGKPARALKLWPHEHARQSLLHRVRHAETLRNVEWQRRIRSGEIRDLLGSIERIEIDGEDCALIFTQDITDRKRDEAQTRKLSSAVEQTADAVMITDPQGVIEYINPAFETVTGFRADEVLGKTPAMLNSGRHDRHFFKHLWATISAGRVYRNVLVNRRKDGTFYYEEKSITPLKDAGGEITHFISTGKDITERMQAQERLQFLAYHDVLTELPNRALLTDRLDNAIARAKRMGRQLAVLFLDLDRFKIINDTLGHDYGDGLLQALSRRLRACIREGDTVARVSGDEFAILLEDIGTNEDIVHVARKLLEAFVQPFDVFNRELFITTSVGISAFPNDGEDATTLLKHADTAMYRAKESGRNNYQFYSADMSARAIELLTLETGLRRALEREEFLLQYQPMVDLNTGQIIGVEALLRWQHRELGLLYPGDFIKLMEETGLIVPVGEWVLMTACRQVGQWQQDRGRPLRLSVNLSARQFSAPDLVDKVQGALRAAALDAELLELEITESMLMEHREATQEMLTALGAHGVRFAVDDFGTGYSSLSYLKRFAIHTLKIDRAFVRDIATDPNDASIVTTIVSMAHNLKLGVVAEGVEREDQLAFLKACRCDAYQGYHYARPLMPAQFEALLKRTTISA